MVSSLPTLKNAFDLVDHDVLLEKLRLYDLDVSSLHLVKSYLTSRKLFTSVKNESSLPRELAHGVPQGSLLAPLLFLIFIKDLPEAVTPPTTVDIFADDNTLSNSATWNEVGTLRSYLGNSILLLEDWSKQNRLHLNIKKPNRCSLLLKDWVPSFRLKIYLWALK